MADKPLSFYAASMNTLRLLLPAAFAITVHTAAAQAPVAEYAGIQVIAQSYGKENNALRPFQAFNDGVQIGIIIKSPGGGITGFDLDKASAVETFTDDKGTALHKSGSFKNGFGSFPKISEDGKAGVLTVEGTVPPAAGAAKVTLKGKVGVRMATKKETVKGGAVSEGAKLTCGAISITAKGLKKSGGDTNLELTSAESLEGIVEINWLDAAGKKLEADRQGSGRMGIGKAVTYSQSWSIQGTPATVEFVTWTDLKTVEVPFHIVAGIGAVNSK
jgi:hypothetical protein